ncbi:MAG: hypothetical protein HY836_09775 [Aquabacterium sp.]|uniref:hypothetical protein n=1 Tax=Aquabacterium sp. TaxID=1872578 RepID=UPI0025BDB590|nr:hypothetical protein [Aquabacterium sp.]MBI5925873.1 hypothetical protein [Aquabacterium sp.]
MNIKFERVQWPVGHGGFHTGRIKGGRADFRYFFDCGAYSTEGKALIRDKLATVDFDFGVISHFDHDHYSELASAKKVKVLFLPYMTQADMVLQALADQAANGLTVKQAFQGFNVLRQLQNSGTRIVMVDGRGEMRDDVRRGNLEELQGGLSLSIPSVKNAAKNTQEMQHEAGVEILQGSATLVYFKFFNHRMEEASNAFAIQLAAAVAAGKLNRADQTAYTNVDDFLADVAAGNAQVVRINGRAMQGVYKKTLSAPTLKASPITGSNLSSLTMFSRSANSRNGGDLHRQNMALRVRGSRCGMFGREDGWMLTGDLELTPKTWPAFNDHYFYELSECSVFSVPHHASEISLCEEAVAFLVEQFFVMPVDAEDDKHPANALTERLVRHGHEIRSLHSVTAAWESMVASESLLQIRS